MNTFRLISCWILTCGAVLANAGEVIHCKDANGREFLTDRPCGAATVGQLPGSHEPAIAVERIDAKDIFSSRTKLREGDTPLPPTVIDKSKSGQADNF
jgi:hypothetical protein